MNRKLIWILLSVTLIAVLVLSACAPAQPPAEPVATEAPAEEQPPAEPVTIRWRTRPDNQQEQDVYQAISDELSTQLEAQGIKLQYDPAPVTGYLDKLTTEFSAKNAPDIVWIPGASTADYSSLGVISDLMPFINKDSSFKLTDYYEAPIKELQQDGKLWGLPRDISTLVLYYNKDLFQKYGVDDPAELFAKGEWTCENFERVAKELTHEADKVYGFSMSNWWGPWGWFIYSHGGNMFNADRTACGLTDPNSIKGLQFMSDLFNVDKVAPPPGIEGGVGETEFLSGSIGMFPNGRWMTPGMRENAEFNWGVVEMPNCGVQSTWLFWGPYVMNAAAEYPDQAWTVLKALTSPEVQARIAELGTNIPSNKAQSAVDAFLNSKPPEDNQPFIAGAAYAQAEIPLYTGNWGDIVSGQYQPNIDNILYGKATVEDAVKAACEGADPLFKQP